MNLLSLQAEFNITKNLLHNVWTKEGISDQFVSLVKCLADLLAVSEHIQTPDRALFLPRKLTMDIYSLLLPISLFCDRDSSALPLIFSWVFTTSTLLPKWKYFKK